jgi:hypothetical protein
LVLEAPDRHSLYDRHFHWKSPTFGLSPNAGARAKSLPTGVRMSHASDRRDVAATLMLALEVDQFATHDSDALRSRSGLRPIPA